MQRYEMIGRIGQDLEIRKTQSGKSILEFSVADTKKVNGNDITTWAYWQCWEGKAETISKYAKKGDVIYLEGEYRNESYQDRNGEKKHRHYFLLNNFSFLPNKPKDDTNKNWSREPNTEALGFDMSDVEWY